MKEYSYTNLILVLILKTSGNWSWYQLQRALDLRCIGGGVNVVKIVNSLIEKGLVKEVITDAEKNLSVYLITDKGEEEALYLIDKYGPETFAAVERNPNDYEI